MSEDFSVTIAASGRYDHHQDPSSPSSSSAGSNNSSSGSTPHVIHAVNVTQPVQSWTVLRDHVDFITMDVALSSAISGLPNCPNHPSFDHHHHHSHHHHGGDADKVIQARHSAQEWLSAVLTVPAVRESPVMRQFLCYGANIVPPQFEDVAWINFTSGEGGGQQQQQQQQGMTEAPVAQAPSSPTYAAVVAANNANNNNQGGPNLDEMEMDDMFALDDDEDDDDHHHDDEDDDDDDDDDASYLQGRYNPTEENITQSDVMEFQQDYKEVEMVEDVGSLAQSLGASHLGRSLGLQKEMMSYKASQAKMGEQVQQMQMQQGGGGGGGIHIMGNTPPTYGVNGTTTTAGGAVPTTTASSSSPGGIGGAMAKAANNMNDDDLNTQPFVEGLGDSFHRTVPVSAPRLDSFRMIKVVGKGSFGKVFLVREKQTNEMFALKVLKKDNIIKRNQVEHTRTERSVLGYVKHPFIVGLNMAFQSKDKLYFVLDYCAGGELFFHLGKVGKFSEQRACFYAAEITLAIAYVHNLDIVYRDLKPENVLLDSRGHVRLTDFGLSKEGISNSSSGANSFCGTPEYLAPEILNRQGHGRAVDWWSLGALLYEMLTGLPPFYCRDREKLFEKIRRGTLEYPKYLSPRAQVILRGLLTKDPRRRLGSGPNDAEDIKVQEFFSELNWEKLMNGDVPPPWDPQINGSMDTSQFDHEFTSMPLNSPGAFQGHGFGTTPSDNVFEGFTFTDRTFYAPPSNKT
jgi:serine/threonine protein kinase